MGLDEENMKVKAMLNKLPSQQKIRSRSLVAFVVVLAFLNVAIPGRAVTTVNRPAPNDLKLRSESQLRTEANLYQTAINEISRISTKSLTTPKDLDEANAIVDKHISNLRYLRSKLIVQGLADSTFTSAVKLKARESRAAEQFAVDLAKERSSIFTVSGGSSLRDRIRRSFDAETAKVRQIAAQLKQAADAIKANTKEHHLSRSLAASSSLRDVDLSMPALPAPDLRGDDIAVLGIVVAVIAFPALGLALAVVAANALGVYVAVSIATAAATLIGRLTENAGTDEGKDRVKACQEEVDSRYRRCVRAAAVFGILAGAARTACYADWLLASAACWVS